MTFFMQQGDLYAPTAGRESLLDNLPVGNYIVVETMQGLMFKRVDSFGDPGRMYGNINTRAERIMTTFMDRPRTTGVLLSGEKGSGKSQLARNVSRLGYEAGLPTILINAPFCGDAFNALLATIEQPAIILMDEFEKVYSETPQQEAVLTLLDGMMTSKKLFVLTVNDRYRVNEHMKNRPGRIFYSIDFAGLEPEFIREYCEENLNDQDEIANVLTISAMFQAFNFDMLKAFVEEMNRYNETAFDAMEMLNAKPVDQGSSTTYEVVGVSPNGHVSKTAEVNAIPMGQRGGALGLYLTFDEPVGGEPDVLAQLARDLGMDDDDLEEKDFSRHFAVSSSDIKKLDVEGGRYQFLTDGFTITFKRKVSTGWSMRELEYDSF